MKRPFFFLTIILHCLTLCSKVWPSAWELALAYRWKLWLFIIRAGPGNDTIFIFFSQAYCSYPTWNKIVGKVLVYFDCLNMSKTKKKVIRHGHLWCCLKMDSSIPEEVTNLYLWLLIIKSVYCQCFFSVL